MKELMKLRELYKLKEVERKARVKERRESSAEHTWSSMILADYLMDKLKLKLDRQKVMEILLYHDIVEIESGDISISEIKNPEQKRKNELKGLRKIKKRLPYEVSRKFERLFIEFDKGKSIEAKFAKAVDKLDAILQHMNHKPDWKGWSEKRILDYHGKAFEFLPEMKKLLSDTLSMIRKKGYFSQ